MAQSFEQLQSQIQVLKAKAAQIKLAESKEVVAKIKLAIEAYGITRQDLFGTGAASASGKQARGSAPSGAGAGAAAGRRGTKRNQAGSQARYRDDAGNVWSGRGPRPRWLKDALAAGKALDDFRT